MPNLPLMTGLSLIATQVGQTLAGSMELLIWQAPKNAGFQVCTSYITDVGGYTGWGKRFCEPSYTGGMTCSRGCTEELTPDDSTLTASAGDGTVTVNFEGVVDEADATKRTYSMVFVDGAGVEHSCDLATLDGEGAKCEDVV